MAQDPAVAYGSYLKIDELLSLQQPRSEGPEHDEMLFIVIHQVYELWFKELLHEFDRVRTLLEQDEPHRVQHTLKRVLTILKVMVAQLDILETMTPLEFLTFRQRLEAASGFQSDQFRQLEFTLGIKSEQAIARFQPGTRARTALERRYRESTVWDAFLHYLAREGYSVPPAHLHRDPTAPVEASPDIQTILVEIYRHDTKNGALRETGRSGRGHAGVAIPAREDGGTNHRYQARNRRIERRRVSANHARGAHISRFVENQGTPVGLSDQGSGQSQAQACLMPETALRPEA